MCDGVWHCVLGDDEFRCNHFSCEGMFKCSRCNFKACIHTTQVCDSITDCCSGEDESLCEFQCPYSCKCLIYALHCSNLLYESISEFMSTDQIYLEFVMVRINQIGFDLVKVHNNTLILKWTQSNLHNLCNILKDKFTSVQYLDFSSNHLRHITKYCFILHKNVQLLLLSNNKIMDIETEAFAGLDNLLKLDLSFNKLVKFSVCMFSTTTIYILNISQNNFKEMHVNDKLLDIDIVSTDDYKLCCLLQASKTFCLRKSNWPQNCKFWLNEKTTHVFCITVGIMILVTNCTTFMFSLLNKERDNFKHKLTHKKHILSSFRLSTLCLHVNDLLFGIYLMAIFFAGKFYNKYYVVHAEEWLNSFYCRLLGVITSFAILNSRVFDHIDFCVKICSCKISFQFPF